MTREEYINNMRKAYHMSDWSKPKFECPECGKFSVCRNETIVLTSFPTKHIYKCMEEYGGCGEYSENL